MKQQLTCRLRTLFIFAFIIAFSISKANVVIGVMNPTVPITPVLYDIDNNGQYDLYVEEINNVLPHKFLIKGLNGTKVETDGNNNIFGYNTSAPIGSNVLQDSGYITSLYYPVNTTRYIGIKLKNGSDIYCCYIEANVNTYNGGAGLNLLNYGYETNTAVCISAGQWPLSVNDEIANNLEYSMTITRSYIEITSTKNIEVKISDIYGRTILCGNTLQNYFNVNIERFSSSILVVTLIDSQNRNIKKTIKLAVIN